MHNISLANKWQIPFVGPFSWYNCVLVSTATCAACVLWKRQLSPPLTGQTWSRQRWPIESHPRLLCDSGIVMWTSLVTRSEVCQDFWGRSFLSLLGALPNWLPLPRDGHEEVCSPGVAGNHITVWRGARPGLKLESGKEDPGDKGSGVLKDIVELINHPGNPPCH